MAMAWSRISSKVMADPPPLPEACRGWSRDGRAFRLLYSADSGERKARSTEDPRRRGTILLAYARCLAAARPAWGACRRRTVLMPHRITPPRGIMPPHPLTILLEERLARLATLAGGAPPVHARQQPPRCLLQSRIVSTGRGAVRRAGESSGLPVRRLTAKLPTPPRRSMLPPSDGGDHGAPSGAN